MQRTKQRIFLTGATGFLGHYLLVDLLNRKDVSCRLLVRDPRDAADTLTRLLKPLGVELHEHFASGLVQLVAGRLPDGLNPSALEGVDLVLHAGASTQFKQRGLEPFHSNVDGTQALLEAVAQAGTRRFCFVSTAYVGGTRYGRVPESILAEPSAVANDYERSKWLAEKAVCAWACADRKATIVRPSILIGDRQSGRATSFGGVYLLARSVELLARAVNDDASVNRHSIPLRIIGNPHVRPNLIPVCWAARRVVKLAMSSQDRLSIHNLVNPDPPASMEIKEWLEEFYDLAGGTFTDMAWPWEEPSRFEEGFYAAGQTVLDYFVRDIEFENGNSGDASRTTLVDKTHFLKCLRYATDHNWGRGMPQKTNPSVTADTLDAAWYFEKFLVRQLPRSKVSKVSGLTAVVRFIVEGPRGGDWTCRYDRGRLAEISNATGLMREQFGFRVQQKAFDRVVRGESRLQDAYYAGDAHIFGDILTALKMVPVMEMFLQEFPVGAAA